MLANEVADALPCRRFVPSACAASASSGSWRSRRDGEILFREESRAAPARTRARLHGHRVARCRRRCRPATPRKCACALAPWIATLGECLGRGLLLISDYGLPRRHYYHRQRAAGTLRCHFRQRAHDDPYVNVGLQDITAWVDFTRVAEAALGVGLERRRLRDAGRLPRRARARRAWWRGAADEVRARAARRRSAPADPAGGDGRGLQDDGADARTG